LIVAKADCGRRYFFAGVGGSVDAAGQVFDGADGDFEGSDVVGGAGK
jgi:hypothetical protein